MIGLYATEEEERSSEFLSLMWNCPADLDLVRKFADEYGVEVVKLSLPYGEIETVHVRLPDGRCGVFKPGGPDPKTYMWFETARYHNGCC